MKKFLPASGKGINEKQQCNSGANAIMSVKKPLRFLRVTFSRKNPLVNVLWVHSSTKKDKMELTTAGLPPKASFWESLISLNQQNSNLKWQTIP